MEEEHFSGNIPYPFFSRPREARDPFLLGEERRGLVSSISIAMDRQIT